MLYTLAYSCLKANNYINMHIPCFERISAVFFPARHTSSQDISTNLKISQLFYVLIMANQLIGPSQSKWHSHRISVFRITITTIHYLNHPKST